MSTLVEIARQEWAEGNRRLEAERGDPERYHRLHAQVDVIVEQLRRRVGGTYTLDELAAEYRRSEAWVLETVDALPPAARWLPGVTTATEAAFHRYALGAQDYTP
ncbi:MAG TPA: hypothetical protein VFA66_11080 [Gaiellaceae bacterium]|nr:hypothetical protein [Gaiellaceae bacterium]